MSDTRKKNTSVGSKEPQVHSTTKQEQKGLVGIWRVARRTQLQMSLEFMYKLASLLMIKAGNFSCSVRTQFSGELRPQLAGLNSGLKPPLATSSHLVPATSSHLKPPRGRFYSQYNAC
eukprot:431329-Pelagomonas_calceolata.AAC.4